MFKDVFVLKKTAYHARMMKYIWGFSYKDFTHICPYFWLSVFNHIAFPIVFGIKEGFKLLTYILVLTGKTIWNILKPMVVAYRAWSKELERKRDIKREAKESREREKRKVQYEKWALYYKEHPKEYLKLREKSSKNPFWKIFNGIRSYHYNEWKDLENQVDNLAQDLYIKQMEGEKEEKINKFLSFYQGDDVEKLLIDGSFETKLREYERGKRQREIEEAARKLRETKERINKIFKIIKPISTSIIYALGTGVVGGGLYYLIKLSIWIKEGVVSIPHKNYVSIGHSILFILKSVGILAILVGVLLGIFLLLRKIDIRLPKFKKKRKKIKVARPFGYRHPMDQYFIDPIVWFSGLFVVVFKIFCKMSKAIGNAISFLIQMFKQNCPAIRWDS